MWARHSHISAPITKITSSKVKFKWNKIKQDVFKEIKRIVARGVLLTYPVIMRNLEFIRKLENSN